MANDRRYEYDKGGGLMKKYVFKQTKIYSVPANSIEQASAIMSSDDESDYLVDWDLEFQGEE